MTLFREAIEDVHRPNPYPLFERLRETPVSRQADGAYVVSSYAEVAALMHDPRLSSDDRLGPQGDEAASPPFLLLDPPEHDGLRQKTMRHFGPPHCPHMVERKRPRLLSIVNGLIDRQRHATEMDLVADLSYPLPVTVICELLGVPPEDESRFHAWSEVLAGSLDPFFFDEDDEQRMRVAVAQLDLAFYMSGLLGERRENPRDDMLSHLVTDTNPMREGDLIQTAILLLVAGHETTVNLVSNGMLALLRHPEAMACLRQEPQGMPAAVEEMLRFDPPVQFRTRRALTDMVVAGTTIPKGALVVLLIAAANRDPQRFEQADRFDPARRDNPHLGFGQGIHYCFGAALARLEAEVALTELLRRLDNPRLVADPPPYRRNPALRGPRQLMIRYDRIRE